jgi:hypothetical protein
MHDSLLFIFEMQSAEFSFKLDFIYRVHSHFIFVTTLLLLSCDRGVSYGPSVAGLENTVDQLFRFKFEVFTAVHC